MNHDVPQPMTAASSPGAGRMPSRLAASAPASSHSSGWLRISSLVTLISARIYVQTLRSKHLLLGYGAQIVSRTDRFGRILELLARDGSVSVGALATDLAVSEATVRRDLQILGEQRLLERSHGGAVAHGTAHELPVRYRTGRSDEKQRIAHAAAELVEEGTAVGLTGGTTTTEVARALATRQDLTVVTNALNIAVELAVRANLKLIVTGGVARSASYELVGPLADATLQGLYVDLAFVGVDGIDAARGLTTQIGR